MGEKNTLQKMFVFQQECFSVMPRRLLQDDNTWMMNVLMDYGDETMIRAVDVFAIHMDTNMEAMMKANITKCGDDPISVMIVKANRLCKSNFSIAKAIKPAVI